MLMNKKRVFWEALLLTLLIFLIGFLGGVLFEEKRVNVIEEYYLQSENSLMDILALNNFVSLNNISCDAMIDSNIAFANRIYGEAKILEEYESSGRLKDDLNLEHKKYDVMRTFLWINTLKTNEICKDKVHTIVYLYEFNNDDLGKKAINKVWSKILEDFKEKYGDEVILIPIAVDSGIESLKPLLKSFEIPEYPVLIIDNKEVIGEISSVDEIENYLNK